MSDRVKNVIAEVNRDERLRHETAMGRGNRDTDHAVAIEREAIAAWHDGQAHRWAASKRDARQLALYGCSPKEAETMEIAHTIAADAIRAGEHHEGEA